MDRLIQIFGYLTSRLNVTWYRFKYTILGRRIVWGKNIRITGKFIVAGEGKLVIGDDVRINGKGHPVTPFTHSSSAEIVIGSRSFLNGTRFGCVKKIEIGEDCILADARIMDTDFHPIDPVERLAKKEGKDGEVIIGNNVWVGAASFILCNSTIGEGSTVGAGSVVKGKYEGSVLLAGNPAKVLRAL